MNKFVISLPKSAKAKIAKKKNNPNENTNTNSNPVQMYLDLGQKTFGKRKTCSKCDMIYVFGDREDESKHSKFCSSTKSEFKLKTNPHQVISRFDNGVIIKVMNNQLHLFQNIISKVQEDLGSADSYASVSSIDLSYLFFFYLTNELEVVGFLLTEIVPISRLIQIRCNEDMAISSLPLNSRNDTPNRDPTSSSSSLPFFSHLKKGTTSPQTQTHTQTHTETQTQRPISDSLTSDLNPIHCPSCPAQSPFQSIQSFTSVRRDQRNEHSKKRREEEKEKEDILQTEDFSFDAINESLQINSVGKTRARIPSSSKNTSSFESSSSSSFPPSLNFDPLPPSQAPAPSSFFSNTPPALSPSPSPSPLLLRSPSDPISPSFRLGVRQIWISSPFRRTSLASRLVDAARLSHPSDYYGSNVPQRGEVAFSQPTESGLRFAQGYLGRQSVWVYS